MKKFNPLAGTIGSNSGVGISRPQGTVSDTDWSWRMAPQRAATNYYSPFGAKRTGKRRKKVGVSNPAHGNHKAFQKREARRRRRARAARPSGPRYGIANYALDNTYGDLHCDPIGDLAAARRSYLADNPHVVELTVQVPRSFYDRYREMFVKHPDLPINVVDFESREWTKEQHEEVLNRPRSHAQERTTTIQLGYSDHLSGVNDEYTDTECEDNYRRPF